MLRWIDLNARLLSRLVGWASLATGLLLFLAPGFSAWLFGMTDQVGLMRYLGVRDIFIGGALLLGRKLALWMLARAIADLSDVAIVIGVLVTDATEPLRLIGGLIFAGSFCCLDFYLAQRLRHEGRANQTSTTVSAARGVEVGRGGVRSAPELRKTQANTRQAISKSATPTSANRAVGPGPDIPGL